MRKSGKFIAGLVGYITLIYAWPFAAHYSNTTIGDYLFWTWFVLLMAVFAYGSVREFRHGMKQRD